MERHMFPIRWPEGAEDQRELVEELIGDFAGDLAIHQLQDNLWVLEFGSREEMTTFQWILELNGARKTDIGRTE